MRSLSSSGRLNESLAVSPATPANTAAASSPLFTPASVASSTPASVIASAHSAASTPEKTLTLKPSTSTPTHVHTAPVYSILPVQNLQEENSVLKEQISQLKQQVKTILDHSIESDTRLMEYTNEVFVAKKIAITSERTSSPLVPPTTAEIAVQCELPCLDQRCAENRELIQRLKTTIEVLEADLQCLRAGAKACDHSPEEDGVGSTGWSVCRNKITVKNRFKTLSSLNKKLPTVDITAQKENGKQNKKRKNKKSYQATRQTKGHMTTKKSNITHQQQGKNTPFSFHSINIESDSHGRLLAGLIKELVGAKTMVSGVVKPGAKLMSVASSLPPSPNSCTVLIAGTNDLADGQQTNIYQHLERRVAAKLRSSKVVIATLPHRHDLPPQHPVNSETVLVNRYIKELVAKYDGVELVDFNCIGRRLFTSHGMHLRLAGKRLLARLVLDSLVRVDATSGTPSPVRPPHLSRPTSAAGPPPAATTAGTAQSPFCLPYDNYAEAVKSVQPSPRHYSVEASPASPTNSPFLDVTGKQGHQCHS